MNFWAKIAGTLIVIWVVAGTAVYFSRSAKPTSESVTAYLRGANIESKQGTDRTRVIKRVEGMLNRLPFEDRQQLQRSGVTRNFFTKLTPDEQAAFLDATLPAGFKQMMESFNKMEPAKRKELVERALTEMKKHEGEAPPPNIDEKMQQRVVDQGLQSFYRDANADVKLDLAPVIEQMQKNLQSGGR